MAFFFARGWLLYYGDAEAHLNIARHVFDSQTPGLIQFGTVWLPLPHALMLPFVHIDRLWRNGLAGAIPSAAAFVSAGTLLFAAVRRIFDSTAAAATSALLFAGNPNVLYLQSTAMTEPLFFACLAALLYATVRFRQTQHWGAVIGAGVACALAALTRYEGWFLIPFVAAYFLSTAEKRRVIVAALFAFIAALGPVYWLAHNWWMIGDPLDFYRGPYSARAIQGSATYPGLGNWRLAWLYFRTAAALCTGPILTWIGLAGVVAACAKRAVWPVVLLALPSTFYLWSMHSVASPIFVPTLWPNTYYNTRYGLAALPLLILGAAALVAILPVTIRRAAAPLVVIAGLGYWIPHPQPENWITWKESSDNSEGRRQWVHEAADYLGPRYVHGSGIVTSFGDLIAIFRQAGIPLHETFTGDDQVPWQATIARPELFLWQEWAVATSGDPVHRAIVRAESFGIPYRLEKSITAPKSPVIEIYRRVGRAFGPAANLLSGAQPSDALSEPRDAARKGGGRAEALAPQ
ncbi:MAG TPA: glycosyltransferase family 39 protein [Bryobacteraceae bacterium]|nr:glycosyltransferase family 39 protein [Bryobacteraceae bacterium]